MVTPLVSIRLPDEMLHDLKALARRIGVEREKDTTWSMFVREMIEEAGAFIEIFVATPLEVCEQRDRKGLYAKARAGIIKEFTGISDPYEEPVNPEMVIDTRALTPDLAAHRILVKLESLGYIR